MGGNPAVASMNGSHQHVNDRGADNLRVLVDPTHVRIVIRVAIHIQGRVADLPGYIQPSSGKETQPKAIDTDDRARAVALEPTVKGRLSWKVQDQRGRQSLGAPLISVTQVGRSPFA